MPAPPVKQTLMVPLGGGLRTDVDPKLLPLGNVLELVNARWTRGGEVVKRFGGNALPTTLAPANAGAVGQAWQLATHKGSLVQLGAGGGTPIAAFSPSDQAWAFHDFTTTTLTSGIKTNLRGPMTLRRQRLTGSGADGYAGAPDVAYAAGYYFVGYETGVTLPQVVCSVVDATTGHVVIETTINQAQRPRVVVVGDWVTFAYVDNGTNSVKAAYHQISTISSGTGAFSATTLIAGAHAVTPFVDAIAKSGTVVSVAARSNAGTLLACDFTPSTGATSGYEIKPGGVSINPQYALGWVVDLAGSGKSAIAVVDSTPAVKVLWNITVAAAVGTPASTYVIDAAPGTHVWAIAAYTLSADASGEVCVVYSSFGVPNAYDNLTLYGYRTIAGGIVGNQVLCRSVMLLSKVWTSNGRYYCLVAYESAAQQSYYVIEAPWPGTSPPSFARGAQARSCVWTGRGRVQEQSHPTSVWAAATGLVMAVNEAIRFEEASGLLQVYSGLSLLNFDGAPTLSAPIEALDQLAVPGGNLNAFDGRTYSEAGFANFPEAPTAVVSGAAGLVAAGTYQYVTVFAYTDSQGRLWRSAPSLLVLPGSAAPLGQVIVGAPNSSIDLTIPTYRICGRTDVLIEIYRTNVITGGGVYNKIGIVANDPTGGDFVTFHDGASDATVASGELLYTTGGVLENDTIPGSLATCVHGRRLCFVSADDPQTVWYSAEFVPGQGLRFNSAWTISFEDERGALTAIASIDSALIGIKKDAVYSTSGDGADTLGRGEFATPTRLALGVGSTTARAVAVAKEGVYFWSSSQRARLHLVDRGGSLQYIGGPVRAYDGETVVSAIVVPSQSQVRLYTASGRTLVYDQVDQTWSTNLGQPSVSAVYGPSGPAYATPTASVVQEDETGATYLEAGVWFGISLTSPWIQVAGLAGYQRFDRIQGVGTTAGAHKLRVRIYQNLDDGNLLVDQSVTPGPLWDWETRYSAKVSALKVVLDEQKASGVTQSAGPTMTALELVVAAKQGLRKLPAANRTT